MIGSSGPENNSGGIKSLDDGLVKKLSRDAYDPVRECIEWDSESSQCRTWCEDMDSLSIGSDDQGQPTIKCAVRSVNLKLISEDQKKDCVEIIRTLEDNLPVERCVKP